MKRHLLCSTLGLISLLAIANGPAARGATIDFTGMDTTTGANWIGVYGTAGYDLFAAHLDSPTGNNGTYGTWNGVDGSVVSLPDFISSVTVPATTTWSGNSNFGQMQDPSQAGNPLINVPAVLPERGGGSITIDRATDTAFELTIFVGVSSDAGFANNTYTFTLSDDSGSASASTTALPVGGDPGTPGIAYLNFDVGAGTGPLTLSFGADPINLAGFGFNSEGPPATNVWTGGNSGNVWSDHTNWTNNPQAPDSPSGQGVAVTFGDASSAGNGAVTLDVDRTVGGMTFLSAVPTTISTANASVLTLDNGADNATLTVAGTHAIATDIMLASNAAVTTAPGGSLTLSGTIGGAGKSVTLSGSGLLTLANAANSYDGGTVLNGGTLQIAALGSLGTGNITFQGGTLQYPSGAGPSSLDVSSRIDPVAASQQIRIDTNGFDVAFATPLSGAGGLTKLGAGSLTLQGSDSYLGSTLTAGGTLVIPAGAALNNVGNINTTNGGTLRIAGTVTMADATAFGVGSGVSGTTGTVVVDSGGVLNIGGGSGLAFIGGDYINSGGTGRVGQYGAGTLTINAGGTVNIAAGGTINGGPGGLDAIRLWLGPYGNSGPSTLNLDGGTLSTARSVADGSSSQSLINFDGGTLQAAYTDTSGQFLAGLLTINIRNGGGTIDTQANDLTITLGFDHSNLEGDNAIDGGLTKIGAGTLYLDAVSTYNGGTKINAGTLNVVADNNLGDPAGGVSLGGGVLQIGGTGVTFASSRGLTLTADSTIDSGAPDNTALFSGSLDLGANTLNLVGNGALTFTGGAIAGAGRLNQNGSGVASLSGTYSFTGPTTVNSGTLAAAGSLAGALQVNDSATLAPGVGAQALTVNTSLAAGAGLSFNGASTLQFQVATVGASPATSNVLVDGDLSVSGTPTLTVTSLDGTRLDASTTYHVIDYTGALAPDPAAWTLDLGPINALPISNWIGGPTGDWDTATSWDGGTYSGGTVSYDTADKAVLLSNLVFTPLAPVATTDVVIAPPAGATVAGPAAATTINSLVIGDGGANPTRLNLQAGGDLTVVDQATINANGALVAGGDFSANQLTVLGGTLSVAAGHVALATTVVTSGATNLTGPGSLGSSAAPITNFTITDGAVTFGGGITAYATTVTANGNANLGPGSTLATQGVSGAGGTINFDGGTLRAIGSTSLLSGLANVYIQAGGATIDSNGYFVSIAQPLVHDPNLGSALDGGLTKAGGGTLSLTTAQSYTGPTIVTGGTLQLPSQVSVDYVGTQFDMGPGWRTAAVPKTYGLDTSNVLGNDGYIVIGANSRMLQPSYIATMTVNGNIYPGNPSYASIDDPSTTPGANPTTIVSGTTTPGNLTFTLGSSVPGKIRIGVMIDGLDVTGYNPNGVFLQQIGGDGLTTPTIDTSHAVAAYNDQNPDWLFFDLNNAAPGSQFTIDGVDGDNSDVTLQAFSFDSGIGSSGNFLPATTDLQVASGATLDLNGSPQTVASLSDYAGAGGTVTSTVTGSVTLTVDGATTSTFHGIIADGAGQLAFVKNGTGTQILAGLNTYSGTTRVNNGTLRIDGALMGAGAVTVGDQIAGHAAILAGGGTIAGAVTVNGPGATGTAGTIAGASGATLSLTGGLTLADGAIASFALTPAGVGNGAALIAVNGNLTLGGAATVNLSGSAAAGTYELFSFSGAGPASGLTLGTTLGGGLSYDLSYLANEVDLIVGSPGASASWNLAASGNYGDVSHWDPAQLPNGGGLTATFGGGTTNPVNSATVGGNALSVTVNGAFTVGALVFDNSSVHYTLASDAVFGDGLTLDSASGSAGTSITVASGSHTIAANLTLADSGVNAIVLAGPTTALTIGGVIGETGGSKSLTVSGGGTLTLSNTNLYSGGTTVSDSTLSTTVNGALGTGPLAVNSTGGAAVVNVGGNESLGALSSAISGGGSAAVNVAAGKTVSAGPASGTTTFGGALSLAAGTVSTPGAAFTKTGSGTEVLTAAPQLGDYSALNVGTGTLRINAATGSASVGTNVTANLSGSGTLELAGAVSALGTTTAANRVDVAMNDPTTTLLVSGGDQQVGGIDGSGTVQINAGTSLTANHVTAGALIIGGDATNSATLTIVDSADDGSPLAAGGFALAGSLTPVASDSASLPAAAAPDSSSLGALSSAGTGVAAVPEPSSIVLLVLGLLCCLLVAVGRRESNRPRDAVN